MDYRYNPEHHLSYPVHECRHCGAAFYAGGPALHKEACPEAHRGYDSTTIVFGPKTVSAIKKLGYDPLSSLRLDTLQKNLPELLT